jgi:hypothetical protein
MIESGMFFFKSRLFIQYFRLKFQILTRIVAQGAGFIWQGEAVNEGISGQLILANESDI